MLAAITGHLATIKLLLPNFVGFRDQDGYTALAIATYHGHSDVVEFLFLMRPTSAQRLASMLR